MDISTDIRDVFFCNYKIVDLPLKAGWWYFFLFKLVFYVGVHTLQYKVIVLGVQQRDSVMHLCVSLLSQILFPIVLL